MDINECRHCIYVSIYLSIYVCIIYPTFVAPWFLRSVYALKCSMYDMLTCVIYNCMHSTEQQRRLELLVSAVKIIDEDRLVNAQAHGINRFSLLRQCSCPATCQHACVSQKWSMGWLLYSWFVTFISTKAWYWAYYSAESPLALLHMYISSGSPPVFLECTSYYHTFIMLTIVLPGIQSA